MRRFIYLIVFFVALFSSLKAEGKAKVYTTDSISNSTLVNLTCSLGEWIHIVTETYHQCTGEACRNISLSSNILTAICVGREMCYTSVTVSSGVTGLTVNYECIYENRFSLCDRNVTGAEYFQPINLHSRSYPVSRAVGQRCRCYIYGRNMTATAYALNFRNGEGEVGINGNGVYPPYVARYDETLLSSANILVIMYYDAGRDNQHAWINVAGSGRMVVSCNRSAETTSTTRDATSPATTIHSTSRLTTITQQPSPKFPTTTGKVLPTPLPLPSLTTITSSSASSPGSPMTTPTSPHSSSFSSTMIAIVTGSIFFLIITTAVAVCLTTKCVKRMQKSCDVKKVDTLRPVPPGVYFSQSLETDDGYLDRVNSPRKDDGYLEPVYPPRKDDGYLVPVNPPRKDDGYLEPVNPPRKDDGYLEPVNPPHTYTRLDFNSARGHQDYTELHVYETFPDGRPNSSQL